MNSHGHVAEGSGATFFLGRKGERDLVRGVDPSHPALRTAVYERTGAMAEAAARR